MWGIPLRRRTWSALLESLLPSPRRGGRARSRSRRNGRRRLVLETLEDRIAPAFLVVDYFKDDGQEYLQTSLRGAVQIANQDAAQGISDVITFLTGQVQNNYAPQPQTIELTRGPLELSGAAGATITIDGGGLVTIVGDVYNANTRAFQVDAGVNAVFDNLTIPGAPVNNGSGITNNGTLTVSNCTFTQDSAGGGGAIRNGGVLTVTGSSFSENWAASGGALFNTGTMAVSGCTFTDNYAENNSGAISNRGAMTVSACAFSGNWAETQGGGGLYNTSAGTGVVTGSTFAGNSAATSGGGVLNYGTLTVRQCTVTGNQATAGGGIANFGGLTADDCTVSGDVAAASGGGIENGLGGAFTLSNGTVAYNSSPGGSGGGVENLGTLTLENTSVSSNSAAVGGGVHNAGSLTVRDSSTVSSNSATTSGGGIDNDASAFLYDSTLAHDSAPAGGAIFNAAAITLSGMTVSQNSAAEGGGFVNGLLGTAGVRDCSFTDNAATGTSGTVRAGAIFNAGVMTLTRASLSRNSAGSGDGGSIYNELSGTLTVSGSSLTDNSAGNGGGAVSNSGTFSLIACTLSRNSAPTGGAIDNGGTMTVASSTLDSNSARTAGGGIHNGGDLTLTAATLYANQVATGEGGGIFSTTQGTLTLADCTLSGNFAHIGGGIYNDAQRNINLLSTIVARNVGDSTAADVLGPASGSYDLIGDGTGLGGVTDGTAHNAVGTGAQPIDPKLGPLGLYGGTVETMPLLSGSPALDGGGILTELASDIDSGTTTSFTVADPTTITATAGTFVLQIDAEQILASWSSGNTFTIVQRGYNGTVPAAHLGNQTGVFLGLDQRGQMRVAGGLTDRGAVSHYLFVTAASNAAGYTGQSLPDAVAVADLDAAVGGFDTILFTPGLNGQTLALTQPLELTGGAGAVITIDGRGAVTVSGSSVSRVIHIHSGMSAVLKNLVIAQGNAGTDSGGAILNDGSLTADDVTITQSSAGFGGGICNHGLLTLSGATVSRNLAGSHGGGIFNDGSLTVRDSTLAENAAHFGGGIANDGQAYLSDVTVALNNAAFGGGIFDDGSLFLATSLVAKNTAAGSPDVYGSVAGSYNLIGDGTDMDGMANGDSNHNHVGTRASPINALLSALGDHGGPTSTLLPKVGSPALNAGSALARLTAALTTGATTLPLDNGPALAVTPGNIVIQIDQEQILVTPSAAGGGLQSFNGFTVLQRGYNGTTAASHNAGAGVFLALDQRGYPRVAGGQTTIGAVGDVPARITAAPVNVTVDEHGGASFSAGSSNPTASVQWQVFDRIQNAYTNIPGATATTLSLLDVLRSQNGNRYRAVFSNTAGTVSTAAATLTVLFVTDPLDQTVDVGQTATFRSVYSDRTALTRWQSSKDGGRNFTDIARATGGTLLIRNAALTADGLLVRAVFTSGDRTVFSAAAALHVNPQPTLGDWSTTHGTVGAAFEADAQIIGGTAPFAVTSFTGSLATFVQPLITEVQIPQLDGTTKNEIFVTIRFTPEHAGTFGGSVAVKDRAGVTVTKSSTFTIAANTGAVRSLVVLTSDGHLLSFAPGAPGTVTHDVVVTGLAKGDVLHTLLVSPAGTLYGVAGNPGSFEISFDNLYKVDPQTGAATQKRSLSADGLFCVEQPLAASFDPRTVTFGNPDGMLRAIDDTGHNELIDPTTGAVTTSGSTPAFVAGDPNQGSGCFFTAVAYTDELAGATSATLYGIATVPALVTLGGPFGDPPPDTGQAHTVAALQTVSAFTIGGANNTAYAVGPDSTAGTVALFTVDLTTGVETRVGRIGSAKTIISLAALPV